MRGAPEDRSRERGEDDERAQAGTADERAEAGVSDPVRRLEAVAARKLGRDRSARMGRERGRDRAHVERALEQVLRVGTELVARAGGRRADHDLLPSDPVPIVVVMIGNRDPPMENRPGEDHLEPGRPQTCRSARVRESRS